MLNLCYLILLVKIFSAEAQSEGNATTEAPEITIYPETYQMIVKGGNTTFLCEITRGKPPPTIKWSRRDGKPLTQNVKEMTKSLKFDSATKEDAGEYICTASNDAGKVDAVVTLEIQPALIISTYPAGPVVEVGVGQPVRLECGARGKPPLSVNWLLIPHAPNGQTFDQPYRMATLSFNAQLNDSKTYVCVASNVDGRVEKQVQLIVSEHGPPIPPSPESLIERNKTVPQGWTYSIVYEEGPIKGEPVLFYWSRKKHLPVRIPHNPTKEGVIVLYNLDPSDSDDYTCNKISQTAGRIGGYVYYNVTTKSGAPELTVSPMKQVVRSGDSFYINCNATGNTPISIYRSSVDGTPLPSSASFNQGLLQFNSTTVNDTGRYVCKGVNLYGQAEVIAEVYVTDSTKKVRTFDGNITMLDHLHKIAEKVKPNIRQEEGNLIYFSLVESVRTNSTNITLQNENKNGPEITLLEGATRQLIDSNITVVFFEEKNKSKHMGDIVVVETGTLRESSYNSVLQVKFEKKSISEPNNPNWTCVYWDSQISKWSDSGINKELEKEFIICLSHHLSTFSILLPDPNGNLFNDKDKKDSPHQAWLTVISRCGSGITIGFLLLLISMNYGKKTGKETRKILMNSSVALLLTHCAYQIHTLFEDFSQCLIIGFMKYYFVLAFLLWTAAEGINMWRVVLIDVFNTKGHIYYKWYKIISWGLPMITTSLGIFFITPQGKCKLKFNKTYDLIFYLVPCVAILGCNLLLFTWMFLNITNKDSLGRLKDKKVEYVVALTQVFGIGWCLVFPFLYFESTQLVAEYVLAGVISTQGLLIFIVRGGIVQTLKQKFLNRSPNLSAWYQSLSESSSGNTSPTLQKDSFRTELEEAIRRFFEKKRTSNTARPLSRKISFTTELQTEIGRFFENKKKINTRLLPQRTAFTAELEEAIHRFFEKRKTTNKKPLSQEIAFTTELEEAIRCFELEYRKMNCEKIKK